MQRVAVGLGRRRERGAKTVLSEENSVSFREKKHVPRCRETSRCSKFSLSFNHVFFFVTCNHRRNRVSAADSGATNDVPLPVIIGPPAGLLLVVFVLTIIIFVLWRGRTHKKKSAREAASGIEFMVTVNASASGTLLVEEKKGETF